MLNLKECEEELTTVFMNDSPLNYFSTIVLEISTTCNLRCPTCRVTQSVQPPCFMDYEKFLKIVHRIRPLIQVAQLVNFSSSEPLIHKRIFDMMDVIKDINFNIELPIITNAMLLDDERANKLLARNINNICVSIDASTPETYNEIRVGGDFNRVIENIKNYIKKSGAVRTIFVSQKKNIHELLDFVDLCADLGIWRVKVTGLNTYRPEHVKECLYSYKGNPSVDKIYLKAQERANERGISLTFKPTKIDSTKKCSLSSTMYIGKDGDVSPCVFFSEESPLSLMDETRTVGPVFWGNVLKEDPWKIWESKESMMFREALMEGEGCRLCGLKYGVIC